MRPRRDELSHSFDLERRKVKVVVTSASGLESKLQMHTYKTQASDEERKNKKRRREEKRREGFQW